MTNEERFREKLKLLNEEFVDFVSSAFQENPSYDLTPSVTDYLNHVKELDKMYAPQPVERKIIVAKRRSTAASKAAVEKPKESAAPPPAPTATVPSPKKVSNGLVEPVGQFAFAPKIQMPEIPTMNKTPVFSAPKTIGGDNPAAASTTPLSQQNRKRRQEPLDYDKMRDQSSEAFADSANDREKSSKDSGSKAEATKTSIFNLPPPVSKTTSSAGPTATPPSNNPLFGGFLKPGNSTFAFNPSPATTTKKFDNFGSKETSTTTTPKTTSASEPPAFGVPSKPSGLFNFGSTTSTASPLTSDSGKSGSGLFSFGSNSAVTGTAKLPLFGSSTAPFSSTATPPTSFSTKPTTDEKSNTPTTAKLPSFNFGGGSSSNTPSSTATSGSASGTPSSSLFGGLIKPGSSTFNWNSSPATSTLLNTNGNGASKTNNNNNNNNNTEGNGAEEAGDAEAGEDAPPPKVEIVKHDEPDAILSTKCSLFNFVEGEYKKVGLGFLHIKKTDAGTQLLIRAATTLGTVLVNTYIKDSFKAEKKAKDKIQFSYPSSEGPKTHLVRIVEKFDDALAYLSGEKKP